MAKILLVEDDEDLASKVRLALSHHKHLVEWVNDGRTDGE
jgi:DNA-binding response OmpR family regulator